MNTNDMDINIILPYIVSIISSLIAGFSSYFVARKQAKEDIKQLQKRHELDIEKERELFRMEKEKMEISYKHQIEKERELFQMEKEKMEISYKHQLELLNKDLENKTGAEMMDKCIAEIMKNPAMQQKISQSINNRKKRLK